MVGGNCTEPGVAFEHLPLLGGYWRAHANTTDVRRCAGSFAGSACVGCGGDACKEANFTGCKQGLTGPYCGLCVQQEGVYYDSGEQRCIECSSGRAKEMAMALAIALPLPCLFILLCLCCQPASGGASKRPRPSGRRTRRIPAGGARAVAAALPRREEALKNKAKILFAFYQIATPSRATSSPSRRASRTRSPPSRS